MVTIRVGDRVEHGPAIDLRDCPAVPTAPELATAVADPADARIESPEPEPVHEYVRILREDVSVPLISAIAAAARSRGARAPHDGEIAALRAAYRGIEPPSVDLADARRAVANARETERKLREQVDRLAGQVEAYRSLDLDKVDQIQERHAETAAQLADAETERVAAEQRLEHERQHAAKARDARERRIRLEDRINNRRRDARKTLAIAWYERFAAASLAAPGSAAPGNRPAEYEGDSLTAACAIAQIANIQAPIFVVDGFDDPVVAHETLGAPVVLVAGNADDVYRS